MLRIYYLGKPPLTYRWGNERDNLARSAQRHMCSHSKVKAKRP